MLLHLGLSSSLGADRMHRPVVAQTLHVGVSLVSGDVNERLVLGGTGSIHVLCSDEWGGVSLVCLTTGGVRGLVDCQDGRVARGLFRGRL